MTGHESFRTEFIPPPGSSVHAVDAFKPPSTVLNSTTAAPALFHASVAVRLSVFVVGQKCNPELEIDEEDERSWHWIVYDALPPGKTDIEGFGALTGPTQEGENSSYFPAATIRLVPPPAPGTVAYDNEEKTHTLPASQAGGDRAGNLPGHPDYPSSKLWDKHEPYAKIGRLATVREFRGRGYAKMLMRQAMEFAKQHPKEMGGEHGWKGLMLLHAQVGVAKWYEALGFQIDEGMGQWWEEGIQHVGMWLRLSLEG